jgi:hypothetical protein
VKCLATNLDCDSQVPGCETSAETSQNCAACGVTCPSNQLCKRGKCTCKGMCGGACTDTDTDAQNCGQCGQACPGACSAGACSCRPPDPANLVRNGNFDRDEGGWTFDTQPFCDHHIEPGDAGGCQATSNAEYLSVKGPVESGNDYGNGCGSEQCVTGFAAGATYDVGAWVRIDQASVKGYVWFSLRWYLGNACDGGIFDDNDQYFALAVETDKFVPGRWTHVSTRLKTHDKALSAQVRVSFLTERGVAGGQVVGAVDLVHVAPVPAGN